MPDCEMICDLSAVSDLKSKGNLTPIEPFFPYFVCPLNPSAVAFTPNITSCLNPLAASFTPHFHSNLNPKAISFAPILLSSLNALANSFDGAPKIIENKSILNLNTSFQHKDNEININKKVHESAQKYHDLENSMVSDNDNESTSYLLKQLRQKNWKKIIIGHLNINSIRNKFDLLADLIKGNIDIMVISETKIDESFPTSQFSITGYSPPYRLDRNNQGGGLLLYVRNDIPSKQIICNFSQDIECITVEINIWKKKWLIYGIYNPQKNNINRHLSALKNSISKLTCNYDNIIILGDFNSEMTESTMLEFCELFTLKNLIKEPTCYKNIHNPS